MSNTDIKKGNGAQDEPSSASPQGSEQVAAAGAHAHGLAHTTSVRLLVAVFGALIALTALTVAVTSIDLGSEWNLIVAMVIATLKAGLVVLFFMHLFWDKRFNLLLFLSALLFLVLFLSLTLNDRSEYQEQIDAFEEAAIAQP